MSRVDAVNVATMKARPAGAEPNLFPCGCVAASDAYFPFRDGLDAVAAAGRAQSYSQEGRCAIPK